MNRIHGTVRRRLRDLGWTRGKYRTVSRGPVVWAEHGQASVVTLWGEYERLAYEFQIEFPSNVPAGVIVATCEALAKGSPRERSEAE